MRSHGQKINLQILVSRHAGHHIEHIMDAAHERGVVVTERIRGGLATILDQATFAGICARREQVALPIAIDSNDAESGVDDGFGPAERISPLTTADFPFSLSQRMYREFQFDFGRMRIAGDFSPRAALINSPCSQTRKSLVFSEVISNRRTPFVLSGQNGAIRGAKKSFNRAVSSGPRGNTPPT